MERGSRYIRMSMSVVNSGAFFFYFSYHVRLPKIRNQNKICGGYVTKGRIVWNVEVGAYVCLDLRYVFKGHATRRQRACSMERISSNIRISGPQIRILT
jgi:hypothetical protein